MIVSVDCWGTLLKGSPTFSKKKIELVKRYMPHLTDDNYIKFCFSSSKLTFNDIIERSGGLQPSIDHLFTYLLTMLNREYAKFDFLSAFIYEYQQLAINCHPIIYSDETIEWLQKIREIKSTLLLLSSNTMFIKGDTLHTCINKLGLSGVFYKYRFSDELGLAKPNKYMYGGSTYHIGDNQLTDGIGAYLAGSKPIIINSTNLTIKDAYNIITNKS